jgi:hypothetical protein
VEQISAGLLLIGNNRLRVALRFDAETYTQYGTERRRFRIVTHEQFAMGGDADLWIDGDGVCAEWFGRDYYYLRSG